MGNTIKRKEVIAYKGMEFNMTCRDFKYEVGKTYKTDKVKLCNCGFHACLNPQDVLDYYLEKEYSRYFKVKLSGKITQCSMWDTKVAATEIAILEEINIKELSNIKEWWKNENVLDLLYFSDGFARVKRGDGLWNFIDKNGKILSDEWFKWAANFQEGFAIVQKITNSLYNFIDTKGKILSNEWFIDAYSYRDGFARVQKANGECCKIDKSGKLYKD